MAWKRAAISLQGNISCIFPLKCQKMWCFIPIIALMFLHKSIKSRLFASLLPRRSFDSVWTFHPPFTRTTEGTVNGPLSYFVSTELTLSSISLKRLPFCLISAASESPHIKMAFPSVLGSPTVRLPPFLSL